MACNKLHLSIHASVGCALTGELGWVHSWFPGQLPEWWEWTHLRSFTWHNGLSWILMASPAGQPGYVAGLQEKKRTCARPPEAHTRPAQCGVSHSVGPNKWQNLLRFQEWRKNSTSPLWIEGDAKNYGFFFFFFNSTCQTEILWLTVLFLLPSNFCISLAVKNTRN